MSNRLGQKPDVLEQQYQGRSPIHTLLFLYRDDKARIALAMVFYVLKHSPVWIMPLLTANIIDIISEPEAHSPSEFWVNGVILALVLLQNIPNHYMFIRFISTAIRKMEANLRAAICRQLQNLSFVFYAQNTTGTLQTKVLRDVEIIEQMTRTLLKGIPSAVTNITAAVIITAIRAPSFLLFFVIAVPVAVLLIRALRRPLRERNQSFREEVESMSSRVTEMIQLIPVTRAHGVEDYEIDKVEKKLEQVREAGIRLDSINAIFGAASWTTFRLFDALSLLVAGWAHYQGWLPISVGDVVLFTGYFRSITSSVMRLANLMPQISKGFESIRSVGEVLESPDLEHNEGKECVRSVEGSFTFESVSYSYPNTDQHAVRGLSFHVEPGETVAIVGESGAGKSTVLNLVIGFLRPSEGRVLLDGRDMNELDLRTYRRHLSVVSQDTILFDGTVRENILYGTRNVSEERLVEAIRNANALSFIEELPRGLETRLGESGSRLSGGQKQRIAIARALIRDPRVLILDEATSSLDSVSEAQIQEALERLMEGRTTFVVAHRLSTVRCADRIMVMEEGRIVEIGTHDELMAEQGVYARLREMQAVPVAT